ncbi:MAG: hypothetical protein WC280_01580 [Patescibacteria group bacterium]
MGFFIKIYDNLILGVNNAKVILANFYRPLYMRVFYILGIVLNLFLWIFSYFIFNNVTQDRIILHYNVDMGIDLIGDKIDIFNLPAIGFLVILMNKIFLLIFLKKKFTDYKFISKYSSVFMIFSQIILILVVFSIYSINFK